MVVIYLNLSEDGYVNGWGSTRSSDSDIRIEMNNEHDFFSSDSSIFKYIDGELIKDEEKQRRLIEEREQAEHRLSNEELNALALMELGKLLTEGGK